MVCRLGMHVHMDEGIRNLRLGLLFSVSHGEQACELRSGWHRWERSSCRGEEETSGSPPPRLPGTQPSSPVPSQGVRDQLPSGNADLWLLCSTAFQSQCVLECVSNQNYPSSLFSKIPSCYLLSRSVSDFSVV